MVGVLTSMKLAVLRRSMSGPRAAGLVIGALFGLAAAVGTVLLGLIDFPPGAAASFFEVVFAVWALGWVLGPMLTGGDALLRLEYFTLLPLRPRRLALGLLGAAFAGLTPIITLVACGLLLCYGVRLGPGAALVAVPAMALQLLLLVLLSKVATAALGGALRSRVGWELSALVVGLVIAFLNTGWFAVGFFVRLFTGAWAPRVAGVAAWLPTGWATVAVDAAGRGDWALTAAALAGLPALCAVLWLVWAAMLGHQLVRGTVTTRSGVARPARRRRLPGTPIGGVIGKELRLWRRDPRRARFLRIAFWIGLFTGMLPVLSGWNVMLPWSGVVAVLFAGALSANLYGLDAGALWLTLVTSGTERIDVRGRQLAWLSLVLPAAVTLTAVMAAFPAPGAMWPWVLAVLPAVLGAAAGLLPLVSLLGPAPFADRPGGNPLDGFSDESGDQVRLQTLIVLFAELVLAAPAAGVVLAGRLLHSAPLQWLGVPAGVLTGSLFAWLFGRIAYRRLRARGPEILDVLRKGPRREPVRPAVDGEAAAPARELPPGTAAAVGLLIMLGILLTLPQGAVALALRLTHAPVRGWFVALHFGGAAGLLIAAGSLLLGLACLASGLLTARAARRRSRPGA
jgi:ABC-2 type transport system permease protein